MPIGLQLAAALAADAALLAAARYDEDLGEGVSTVRLGDLVVSLVRSEHAYPACPAGTRTS